ncbi:MAG: zinc metallochaperone AztD [Desertimonas sp.]
MQFTSRRSALVSLAIVSFGLTGVAVPAAATTPPTEPTDTESDHAHTGGGTGPVVLTYDGGILVVDGETLDVVEDLPLEGFNRVDAAGDDHHVVVRTAEGFVLLDAMAPELTDQVVAAEAPGHVVPHGGVTALFDDASGVVTIVDTGALDTAGFEPVEVYEAAEPHHGFAVVLGNGDLALTVGDSEERTGMVVLDAERTEIARNEECAAIHGEGTAADDVLVAGCGDGVLIYRDGEITKVTSPDPEGRIGTIAGSSESPVVLGNYSSDPDAAPEQVSLVDTEAATITLVDLGASYTFRSLGRGAHGEALVLGTDGALHVIDPTTAEVTVSIPVVDAWEEPEDWQLPRPALFVRDHTVYVSDPAANQLHTVDIEAGEVTATGDLPATPNEIAGVLGDH